MMPNDKNSSVEERRAARGGTTRPDERITVGGFFKEETTNYGYPTDYFYKIIHILILILYAAPPYL